MVRSLWVPPILDKVQLSAAVQLRHRQRTPGMFLGPCELCQGVRAPKRANPLGPGLFPNQLQLTAAAQLRHCETPGVYLLPG